MQAYCTYGACLSSHCLSYLCDIEPHRRNKGCHLITRLDQLSWCWLIPVVIYLLHHSNKSLFNTLEEAYWVHFIANFHLPVITLG